MMIRFTKRRALVALLLTATFVGSYLFAGTYTTAKACQLNNCTDGCHLYVLYGRLRASGAKWCFWVPDGVYLDNPVVHVGATVPGGIWAAAGPDITLQVREDCCFRCLGNTPPGTYQETMTYTGRLPDITGTRNTCDGSSG